jgi:hypothetical protein
VLQTTDATSAGTSTAGAATSGPVVRPTRARTETPAAVPAASGPCTGTRSGDPGGTVAATTGTPPATTDTSYADGVTPGGGVMSSARVAPSQVTAVIAGAARTSARGAEAGPLPVECTAWTTAV